TNLQQCFEVIDKALEGSWQPPPENSRLGFGPGALQRCPRRGGVGAVGADLGDAWVQAEDMAAVQIQVMLLTTTTSSCCCSTYQF
ncbi:unnamed protein product, partial [Heterosigma akashiwo]